MTKPNQPIQRTPTVRGASNSEAYVLLYLFNLMDMVYARAKRLNVSACGFCCGWGEFI